MHWQPIPYLSWCFQTVVYGYILLQTSFQVTWIHPPHLLDSGWNLFTSPDGLISWLQYKINYLFLRFTSNLDSGFSGTRLNIKRFTCKLPIWYQHGQSLKNLFMTLKMELSLECVGKSQNAIFNTSFSHDDRLSWPVTPPLCDCLNCCYWIWAV